MATDITIAQYLVDTRSLWSDATKTKDLERVADRAMRLLTPEEQTKVLKYFFIADAKMALVSALLKHWIITTTTDVPWCETHLTRDKNGKPIFVNKITSKQPLSFNVSHQAGLVSLIAAHSSKSQASVRASGDVGSQVEVGTDIVCTSERRERDHKMIRESGWGEFVDMHADVFGRAETRHLKELDRQTTDTDAKLRAFYTLWCYREAYVKMTGDALLASWLNDLEFKNFRAPARGHQERLTQVGQSAGEIMRDCEILLSGEKIDDANICLRALGESYMTCSAIRTPGDKAVGKGLELGPYEFLSLEQILDDAEAAGGL